MKTLVLLAIVAAVAAAPGGFDYRFPANTVPFVQSSVIASAAAPVAYTTGSFAGVPVQNTFHYYDVNPFVTGYSNSIVKPAIVDPAVPATLEIQAQPIVSQYPTTVYKQLPPLPDFPIAPPNGTADFPQFPGFPGVTSTTPAPESTTPSYDEGSSTTTQQPGAPAPPSPPPVPAIPAYPTSQPLITDKDGRYHSFFPFSNYQSIPVAQPAFHHFAKQDIQAPVHEIRAAQAGDFEPLVTKEKVFSPLRTESQVTHPQLTQIQQDVQFRKIVHNAPITQSVFQSPVFTQYASPAYYTNPGQYYQATWNPAVTVTV